MTPTRPADAAIRAGRWRKAQHFAEAAEACRPVAGPDAHEDGDAYVTLAVHAGIAAADVLCIARLGVYSPTGAHDEALQLLGRAEPRARAALGRLLASKTKAAYTHNPISHAEVVASERALTQLMDLARQVM